MSVISLHTKFHALIFNDRPPSSAEVNEFLDVYLHSPNTPSWRGVQLKQSSVITLPSTFYETERVNIYVSRASRVAKITHNLRNLYSVALVSLPPHKYALTLCRCYEWQGIEDTKV